MTPTKRSADASLSASKPVEPQTCPRRYPEHGESPDHDWEERWDSDGDPNVINGTRTWKVRVCRICGEED